MKAIDTHLGRSVDGELRPAYVTPDRVNPDLLVALSRSENRLEYQIESVDFVGYDRWNCYEFSTMNFDGFPLSGQVQIVYESDTFSIVESKSLKLYLNSFNLHRMTGVTVDELQAEAVEMIAVDLLSIGIECQVRLTLDGYETGLDFEPILRGDFENLEHYLLESGTWNEEMLGQPLTLNITEEGEIDRLTCNIRSNCKVTNQPDWGRVYVVIEPGQDEAGTFITISPEALFTLVVSLREENHFHEEICEMLYAELSNALHPKNLLVACAYLRRGGIDINPVRSSSKSFLELNHWDPVEFEIAPGLRQ